ncbi:hypothetical protein LCGC14_2783390, partial [marine sediment metagenome]
MAYKFITFNKNQGEMESMFDESLLGLIHICIGSNNDYTLCGHATDEYNIGVVKNKPTCKSCMDIVRDCKSI